MNPRAYEIVFSGEAGPAVAEAFEDFDVIVCNGRTVLQAELPDAAALHGTLDRLRDLGLELLGVSIIEPDAGQQVRPAANEAPGDRRPHDAKPGTGADATDSC